jgi:hypothetical protein
MTRKAFVEPATGTRLRPGEYHTDAPVRHRGNQIQKGPQCRAENARADTQCSLGLGLLADDGKFMPRLHLRKENKFTVGFSAMLLDRGMVIYDNWVHHDLEREGNLNDENLIHPLQHP